MAFQNFYYDEQIRKYLIQFMAIFSDMRIKMGKNDHNKSDFVDVDIHYGHKDRVVAHIISGNTQNANIKLPTMSVYINEIRMTPERRKGIGTVRRTSYLPRGGLFPDDITTVKQVMPVPYDLGVELAVFSSNTDQHFQIVEQILMLFDPTLQIQKNDAMFDWTKISIIELENINFDSTYPSGTERKVVSTTFNFRIPIYIAIPANLKTDFIKDIYIRLGVVETADDTPADIISTLDQQGIEYEKWFSLEDIDIDDNGEEEST